MELNKQIFDELSQCELTDQQIKLIGRMVYQICEDFELGLLNIYDDGEDIRITLLDEMEQTGASIFDDELEILNGENEDEVEAFVKTFTNELKVRFS